MFRTSGFHFKALAYALGFFVSVLTIGLLLAAKNPWLKWVAFLFVVFSAFVDQLYLGISKSNFGFHDLALLYNDMGFGLGPGILETYQSSLEKALVRTGVGALCLALLVRSQTIKVKNSVAATGLLLSIGIAYYFLWYSIGGRQAVPSAVRLPALTAYLIPNSLYEGDRSQVQVLPDAKSDFDHIIWVVDESIRGDHLQINNPKYKTTPLLNKKQDQFISLGVCSSGAVCSDYSDIMLISGLSYRQTPDKQSLARKQPSIFQYAEKAGFETVWLSAPGYEDTPKSLMTEYDHFNIDHRINTKLQYPDAPAYELDFLALAQLDSIVSARSKTFTFFLKNGAHAPYHLAFPGVSQSHQNDAKTKPYLKDYHQAIEWTTDLFLDQLVAKIADKNALIIYTSDHGQNLQDDTDFPLTHCAKGPAIKEMAMVPLMLHASEQAVMEKLRKQIPVANYDRCAHANIFPSTLRLMGYNMKEIDWSGEASFFESLDGTKRYFVSGDLFGRSHFFLNEFK